MSRGVHELGGAFEFYGSSVEKSGPAAQQTPMNNPLEAMASELAREGNRPEGERSELFRTHPLWEGGL